MSLVQFPVPPISFFWGESNGSTSTILPSCSFYNISIFDNPGSAVDSVPPFSFFAAPVNGTIETQTFLDVGEDYFIWTANFPVGTSFVLAMGDSAGNSGGSVGPYTIGPGSSNCTMNTNVTPISVVYDPPNTPCGEMIITVAGGIPPYLVSILSPSLGRYSNLTTSNNPIRLNNTITNGAAFYLVVQDSTGQSSLVSNSITSALGSATCSKPSSQVQPTASSPSHSIAAIVGGTVAGVFLSILLVAVYFYYRRKKAAEAYEQHQQQDVFQSSTEYTVEGKALITPFVLIGSGGTNTTHHSNHSPIIGSNGMSEGGDSGYNHAYAGLPPIQSENVYPMDDHSPLTGPYTSSPHTNSQYHYSPTPSSHPSSIHPPNPNSNPPSNPNSNYSASIGNTSPHNYQHNGTSPPLPSLPNGLANPNDFEYRDSRTGY